MDWPFTAGPEKELLSPERTRQLEGLFEWKSREKSFVPDKTIVLELR